MKPWYEIKGDDEYFETAVNILIEYLENNKNNSNMRISYDDIYNIGFEDEDPKNIIKYNEKEITITVEEVEK